MANATLGGRLPHREAGGVAKLERIRRDVGEFVARRIGEGFGHVGFESVGQIVDVLGRQVRQLLADAASELGDLGCDVQRCGHDRTFPSSSVFMVCENSDQTLRWLSSMERPSLLMP